MLMQGGLLLPGWTRNADVPTARPNAAAASADTDENGRVCVDGLGPCALLLKPRSEHQQPVCYCQGGLETRTNQLHDRMPPLRAPIPTKMVVSASMASVLVRCCSSRDRSTSSLLICADCMRRMHRVQGAADDVTALLIAALTASTHANRPALQAPAVRVL